MLGHKTNHAPVLDDGGSTECVVRILYRKSDDYCYIVAEGGNLHQGLLTHLEELYLVEKVVCGSTRDCILSKDCYIGTGLLGFFDSIDDLHLVCIESTNSVI